MAARLGLVLYWFFGGAAGLLAIGGVASLFIVNYKPFFALLSLWIIAAFVYGIGRACSFVLSGK